MLTCTNVWRVKARSLSLSRSLAHTHLVAEGEAAQHGEVAGGGHIQHKRDEGRQHERQRPRGQRPAIQPQQPTECQVQRGR
jgi:hypothetical protein